MIRTSINMSCAKCVKELYYAEKEIFSASDIRKALTVVGRGSTTSQRDYMGKDGYLSTRGFLERVQGGWIIAPSSMKSQKIEVWINVGNEHLIGEVSTAVDEALERFRGITSTIMEV